jgi:putative endonuclease
VANLPAGRQDWQTQIMFFVYAIKSIDKNYIYVGLTNNIQRRLSDHNKGYNKTTKPYFLFYLICLENYSDRLSARKREKYLKSGVGKEYLKKLLINSQIIDLADTFNK